MNTTEKLSEASVWTASKNVVACDVEGEMVLLDMQSGTYFGLNKVGAEIWSQLTQRKCIGDIQQHLLGRYRVTPERCDAELQALISQLIDRGLVRNGSDDTTA